MITIIVKARGEPLEVILYVVNYNLPETLKSARDSKNKPLRQLLKSILGLKWVEISQKTHCSSINMFSSLIIHTFLIIFSYNKDNIYSMKSVVIYNFS